jgi:CspA family cold shock protein
MQKLHRYCITWLSAQLGGQTKSDGEAMAQYAGKVAWFNNAKGYGFLSREGGPDVFVHYSAVQADGYKTLKEADAVEFDVANGTSGKPQAENVRRVNS